MSRMYETAVTTASPFTSIPTTAAPPQDDVSDGHCSNMNNYVLVYIAGPSVLIFLIAVCRYAFVRVPSSSTSRTWGRPYTIASFLFAIALWNMLPQVITFVLFHIVTTDLFELQRNAACILLLGIPVIPAYIFVTGMSLLLLYDAEVMKSTMSKIFFPTTSEHGKNVLVCGVTGRGMVFVDALEKEHSGASKSKTVVVDYAHRWKAFVAHNIAACGITSVKLEDCFFESVMTSDGNEFGLPFPDNTFDRIVIPPFLRNANPIGEFTVGEEVKQRRMQKLLREALRVLKQGGEFVCVDQAANAIAIWADLRDAGLTPVVEETGVELGPSFLFRKKCLKVVALQAAESQQIPPFSVQSDERAALLTINNAEKYSSRQHARPISPSTERFVCYLVQFLLSVCVIVGSFAIYSTVNVPTSIPLSQRANNLIISVATSYPMMAYFSSEARFGGDETHSSVVSLLSSLIKSEVVALVASLLINVLFGVPTLILQIALSSSSLSSDTRSYIGMGISVFIAITSYKRGRAQIVAGAAAKRHIPSTYVDYCTM